MEAYSRVRFRIAESHVYFRRPHGSGSRARHQGPGRLAAARPPSTSPSAGLTRRGRGGGRAGAGVADVAGDGTGVAAQQVAELGRADAVHASRWRGDADRSQRLAGMVEDRSAHAADPLLVLLVVHRVAARPDAL